MRYAYGSDRSDRSDTDASSEQRFSGSERSYQTAPTEYSSSPGTRPPQVHYNSCESRRQDLPAHHYFPDRAPQESPRSSTETYASTVNSEEEVREEIPVYDLPDYAACSVEPSVIPATPSDFSDLFPSRRRLRIRHDDATLDGNMNLRVDTDVTMQGRNCDMTLFHLRMHDLRNREFSLRRYCRDSGREVCHSILKQQKPSAPKRPSFQRSWSNAFSSIRPKSDPRTTTLASLQRNDSGYGSMHSVDCDNEQRPRSEGYDSKPQQPSPTDTIKLEFSNYAQLDIKRCGGTNSKRYEFEYWGPSYAWRRIVRQDGVLKETAYHLTKAGSDKLLAYIMPASLTPAQQHEEHAKGGWIPPCSMWIADDSLLRGQQKDVADVVIASGLMALVDDCIRARFQSSRRPPLSSSHSSSTLTRQLTIPLPKSQMGVEYIGPKRFITEMFRRDSGSSSRYPHQSTSSRPSSSSGHGSTSSRTPTGAARQYSQER